MTITSKAAKGTGHTRAITSQKNKIRLGLWAAAMAATCAAPVATAQERVLEEVIVSAQKFQESSQDVPISLSLVSSENLADVNIFDFTETAELTPGVDLNSGLQSAAIRVRGVGPAFFAINSPQSVAVFVDEVPQSQVGAVFTTLVDVKGVELLRGPQGTLYGQNAPGGVYNIRTKAPNTQEVEGYIEGSYSQYEGGSYESTTDVRGAINIPLVEDVLALRLAGVYRDEGGFVELPRDDATENTTGNSDARSIRAKLLWNINSDMELTVTGNAQNLIENRVTFNFDGLVPINRSALDTAPRIVTRFEDNHFWGDRGSESSAQLRDISAHYSWDAGWTNVDILGSYQEFETTSDENRAPFFGGNNVFLLDILYESTSFEFRVSDQGDVFDYVAGLYYQDRPVESSNDISFGPFLSRAGSNSESTIYSAFANVNFHLTEKLDIAVGLRYDETEVELDTASRLFPLTTPPEQIADIPVSLFGNSDDFDHVSWSVKFRYYLNEATTAYIALDNAFKQGGFNAVVAGIGNPDNDPNLALAISENLDYDEETSTAFEIGVKGALLDDRLKYNAAIFYQEFDDHQVAHTGSLALGQQNRFLFTGVLTNADEVVTQGIEFDFTYLIGDYWELSTRAAYFDAEAKEWNNRFCLADESTTDVFCPISDEPLNDLPRWNTNVQLAYERPIGEWDFYSRINWTWQSGPNFTEDPSADEIASAIDAGNPEQIQDFDESKSRIGFTIGMRSEDLGLDVKVWGKNITNEDLNINPTTRNNNVDGQITYRGTYFPPREIGVTVGYNF